MLVMMGYDRMLLQTKFEDLTDLYMYVISKGYITRWRSIRDLHISGWRPEDV